MAGSVQRMYLIPEDIVKHWRGENRAAQVDNPMATVVYDKDADLMHNLNNRQARDSDKALLHAQHLASYLGARDKLRPGPPPPAAAPAAAAQQQQQQQLPYVSLESIPKQNKRQAGALLKSWASDPSVTWDDFLQVSVDGRAVPGSNVVDLIRDAVGRHKKGKSIHPAGFQEMKVVHLEHNHPLSLTNNSTWQERTELDPSATPTSQVREL